MVITPMGGNAFHETLQKKSIGSKKTLLWMACKECIYVRNYARYSDTVITSQILRFRELQSILEHQGKFLEEMAPRISCKAQRESGLLPSGACGLLGPHRRVERAKRHINSAVPCLRACTASTNVPFARTQSFGHNLTWRDLEKR